MATPDPQLNRHHSSLTQSHATADDSEQETLDARPQKELKRADESALTSAHEGEK